MLVRTSESEYLQLRRGLLFPQAIKIWETWGVHYSQPRGVEKYYFPFSDDEEIMELILVNE